MSTFFPNKGDEPGDVIQKPLGGEAGGHDVTGPLIGRSTLEVFGDTTLHGNLILSNTSIVDISAGTIYTFADPIIDLNTSFTGLFIPEAGLRIFRGDFLDPAYLRFTENALRTVLEWRIGVGADLLRIGRIADVMTDRHALYWDNTATAMASHPNIAFNATDIAVSIPAYFDLPAGQPASYFRYNAIIDPAFSIQRYAAGVSADAIDFGFKTFTYDGHTFTGAARASALDSFLFAVRTPTHDRARFVFEDVASMGLDDATTALLRTDLATMRIEGTTGVGLRAGVSGTDQLTVTAAAVTSNVDVDFDTHLLTGRDSIIDATASGSQSFYLPAGLNPLPTIAGWPSTVTYDGVTSTLVSAEANARTKYELNIAYTIAAGAGANFKIYAPINIGNDMANIRNIYGVVRLMSGAVVQRVYGLPPNDISIEAPFDVDLPFLSAVNLVGYHLLSINLVKVLGSWEIVVTVETLHPLVHAP